MSGSDLDKRSPDDEERRQPQDPAGTQPRYDPASLLPAAPVPDDVVDADVVEEREEEREDMLPARREAGGAAEPVGAAKHSTFAPRFHFLTGALMAVGLAALAGVVLFIVAPNNNTDDSGVRTGRTGRPRRAGRPAPSRSRSTSGSSTELPTAARS